MQTPQSLPALDTKALAARWGLKPSTLENWRNLGKGPVYRKIGGRVIYAAEDVVAFEESSKRSSTKEQGKKPAAKRLVQPAHHDLEYSVRADLMIGIQEDE